MSEQGRRDEGGKEAVLSKEMRESVQEYYGKVLSQTSDLKTNACLTSSRPHKLLREAMKRVPDEVMSKYYGCGNPLPMGIQGLNVLDLGSGSGRDCYICADLVGEEGFVTGIDMTDEQLDVARRNVKEFTQKLGYAKPNLRFIKGYIEMIKEAGVQDESQDLVISNCVVNLSPNKRAVIQGVYNALKQGGEFYFSDVYSDRRLPEDIRKHEVLVGECIGGALYVEDFKRICREVGFTDPRELSRSDITVNNPELQDLLGNARFYSITYRLFKHPGLETLCEDYGQVATYKGTLPGHKHFYDLDDHHRFYTGKPMLVCGNSAIMTGESWLAPHFDVVGDTSVHYGLFDCSPASSNTSSSSSSSSQACGTGSSSAASAGGCC